MSRRPAAAYVWTAPTSCLGLVAMVLTWPSWRVVDGVIEAHGAGVARLLDAVAPGMTVQAMTLGHGGLASARHAHLTTWGGTPPAAACGGQR